jgi:hypothetical protein
VSGVGDGQNGFPKLPIVVVDPPPQQPSRTQREKYGGLFYLGIAGLAILCLLIAWFGFRVWQLRDVWSEIYALHDAKRSEAERIRSAEKLTHDPRVTDHQLMEICLRRDLPDQARYLLAEAVSTDAVARDPRAYALAVALSRDWPDWLRLVLSRRLAYGATRGYAIPEVALEELAKSADPMIRIWADYSLAAMPGLKSNAAVKLGEAARARDENGTLAAMLLAAKNAPPEERESRLDEATVWLRHHHPEVAKFWRDQVGDLQSHDARIAVKAMQERSSDTER